MVKSIFNPWGRGGGGEGDKIYKITTNVIAAGHPFPRNWVINIRLLFAHEHLNQGLWSQVISRINYNESIYFKVKKHKFWGGKWGVFWFRNVRVLLQRGKNKTWVVAIYNAELRCVTLVGLQDPWLVEDWAELRHIIKNASFSSRWSGKPWKEGFICSLGKKYRCGLVYGSHDHGRTI